MTTGGYDKIDLKVGSKMFTFQGPFSRHISIGWRKDKPILVGFDDKMNQVAEYLAK